MSCSIPLAKAKVPKFTPYARKKLRVSRVEEWTSTAQFDTLEIRHGSLEEGEMEMKGKRGKWLARLGGVELIQGLLADLGDKLVAKLKVNPWPSQILIVTPCELSTVGRGGVAHESVKKVGLVQVRDEGRVLTCMVGCRR